MIKNHISEEDNYIKRCIKEILIFFSITYGVSLLFGIFFYIKKSLDPNIMAFFMMVLPGSGVSMAKLYKNRKNDKNRIMHFIVLGAFCLHLCLVLLVIFEVLSNEGAIALISICLFLLSPSIMLYAWLESEELAPFKNSNIAKPSVLIFLLIITISVLAMSQGKEINYFNLFTGLIYILPSFVLQSLCFFGEEYGWRGFLQEKMQRKFGKRKGVILLGIIWELWHMPLWFTCYNVDGLGILLRFLFVVGLAIFLGYVYMKTKNVWVCALIHFLNNTILLSGDLNKIFRNFNATSIDSNIVIGVLIYAMLLSLFIFTKEYNEIA